MTAQLALLVVALPRGGALLLRPTRRAAGGRRTEGGASVIDEDIDPDDEAWRAADARLAEGRVAAPKKHLDFTAEDTPRLGFVSSPASPSFRRLLSPWFQEFDKVPGGSIPK